MKMIVSDYDGTIKRFEGKPNIIQRVDFIKDLKTIRKFIEEGNTFTISSKRTITSIKQEIEKYAIPYNYVTAYGGLVTFDQNKKLIDATFIPKEILQVVSDLSRMTNILENIAFYDANGNVNYSLEDNLVLLKLTVNNVANAIQFFKKNNIDFNKYNFSYGNHCLWIKNRVNKKNGITSLLEKIDAKPEEIIVVGDSFHDLEMVNEYDGFCIVNGELDRYSSSTMKRTKNIRRLIKTIK